MNNATYRITSKALDRAVELKVPAKHVAVLRKHEGLMSSGTGAFEIRLRSLLGQDVDKKTIESLLVVCMDVWGLKRFNTLEMGAMIELIPKFLKLRRVPGGWIYEYYNLDDEVCCAAFVSTDELRRM